MSKVTGKAIDAGLLKRMYTYALPYKKIFYIAVGLTILLALVSPVRPYLVQYTIDHFIMFNDADGLVR
jgi:ATP-binding cassette subfamily B multidrug efflux pump